MIWHSSIDFIFNFLELFFTGFGFFENNVLFELTDLMADSVHVIDSLVGIIQPYMEFVFFFIPVTYISPIFVFIAVFYFVRLIVSVAKTLWDVLPYL